MNDLSKNVNQAIVSIKKDIKKNQSEIKNTITGTKNILGRINSRLEEAENQIINLEDKVVENTHQKLKVFELRKIKK